MLVYVSHVPCEILPPGFAFCKRQSSDACIQGFQCRETIDFPETSWQDFAIRRSLYRSILSQKYQILPLGLPPKNHLASKNECKTFDFGEKPIFLKINIINYLILFNIKKVGFFPKIEGFVLVFSYKTIFRRKPKWQDLVFLAQNASIQAPTDCKILPGRFQKNNRLMVVKPLYTSAR